MNRVFDSSGPEGRVRGTPQQIIEKYQMLARDAQLSGDRVATENFLQHSEHYSRMLVEAQREMAERQEQQQKSQERSNQNVQGGNQNTQSSGQNTQGGNQNTQGSNQNAHGHTAAPKGSEEQPDVVERPQPRKKSQPESADVLESRDADDDNSLVETPENGGDNNKPKPRIRQRAPAKSAVKTESVASASDASSGDQPHSSIV